MDVRAVLQGDAKWLLMDPLNRSVGTIELDPQGILMITPIGMVLIGMVTGPYTSLDQTMKAIEVQAKGRCWVETGMNLDP